VCVSGAIRKSMIARSSFRRVARGEGSDVGSAAPGRATASVRSRRGPPTATGSFMPGAERQRAGLPAASAPHPASEWKSRCRRRALASIVLMLLLGPGAGRYRHPDLRALATRLKDDLAIIDFRIAPETHTLDLDLGVSRPRRRTSSSRTSAAKPCRDSRDRGMDDPRLSHGGGGPRRECSTE